MYYKKRNLKELDDADMTILFTKRMNDLFDSLNSSKGIKLGSAEMKVALFYKMIRNQYLFSKF